MKKLSLFLFLLIVLNKAHGQMSSNIILGKIIDTEGEYVFISTESDKEAAKGMIFGIYNTENDAIGVCEISKIIKNGNYIAHVLTQTDEIKKGDTALADIEKEHKLREKVKEPKISTNFDTTRPKVIRMVFQTGNSQEVIKQVIDKILKYSNYIAKENEDIQDITSPVSCIIYATPQTFADEIDTFDFEGIGISVLKVYGDTIEFKIW